jgi:hypothetical protein
MKTKLLFCVFLFAYQAFAQWSDFCSVTTSTNLCNAMNGKLSFQTGSGAPTAIAGTQGKDVYTDTVTGDMYWCIVTGNPATWLKISGSGTGGLPDPGGNGVVVRTASNTTTHRSIVAGSSHISVTNPDGTAGNPTIDLGSVSSANLTDTACAVTVGATPAMDTTSCNGTPGEYVSFKLGPLAQNASPTFANGIAGREYAIQVYQGTSTAYTVTWPGNLIGGCAVDPTLSSRTLLLGVMDSTGSNLLIQACAYIDQASTIIAGPTRSAPSTPASGNLTMWFDSIDNTVKAKNSSGTVFAMQSTAAQRRTCTIVVGADDASSPLSNSDLSQARWCYLPYGSTITEIMVSADAGTPNVIVGRNRAGVVSNLVSSALATAAAGALACSNTGGTTGFDGASTCGATLQNTSINAGDWLDLVSGTAGGTAKRMSIAVTYTIQ